MAGKKRGPPQLVASLKIYLDIMVQNKKTMKHPKIKLSDVLFHTINEKLNVESTYDEILAAISKYLSTDAGAVDVCACCSVTAVIL